MFEGGVEKAEEFSGGGEEMAGLPLERRWQ